MAVLFPDRKGTEEVVGTALSLFVRFLPTTSSVPLHTRGFGASYGETGLDPAGGRRGSRWGLLLLELRDSAGNAERLEDRPAKPQPEAQPVAAP